MRSASHCAARLAAGMNVGLGFAASCSVVIRTPPPKRRGRGLHRSALSTVCITSTITVRRDQLGVASRRAKLTGSRAIAARQRSGRVIRVPSSTRAVNIVFIAPPPAP